MSSPSNNVLIRLTLAMNDASASPRSNLEPGKNFLNRDPHQRDWNQHLPAKPHDLIVSVARKCGPEPQKYAQQHEHLQHQPVRTVPNQQAQAPHMANRVVGADVAIERAQPAAEKEHRSERRDKD